MMFVYHAMTIFFCMCFCAYMRICKCAFHIYTCMSINCKRVSASDDLGVYMYMCLYAEGCDSMCTLVCSLYFHSATYIVQRTPYVLAVPYY